MIGSHNPEAFVKHISPTPLLITVLTEDDLAPADLALRAFNKAREPKELQMLEGGHFDCYAGRHFERNAATQTAFLKKWLGCKVIE
jgi:fermentation-respiration switch protein FrsA (DUF1100 family)